MKALVKSKAAEGVWLEDVPEPTYGIDDVLIKVLKTGICGTDVHIYNWDAWSRKTVKPETVIGHEFVGRIVAVGSNVQSHKVGDLVSAEGHIVCGYCRNCLAGRRHLCANTLGVGVNRNGAFAELVSVPAMNIWNCDAKVPLELYAIYDPLGNAAHTALSFDLVGEDVLITGAGPVGCLAAAVVRHAGARHIVITDVNPARLSIAEKMGVSLAVDVRSSGVAEAMAALGMEEGFDVGLEMSGNKDALRSMIAAMAHGGRVGLLGFLEGETPVELERVIFGGLTLRGIYGREMFETWYKMTAMVQSGLDVTPVITHHFPVAEYEEAFGIVRSGHSGKVILDWPAALSSEGREQRQPGGES
jgi:threonine 3-dehydrogenase